MAAFAESCRRLGANAVVHAGKVRRLAVSSSARFPSLPNLLSLHESMPSIVRMGRLSRQ
jgi:hypothetical protein